MCRVCGLGVLGCRVQGFGTVDAEPLHPKAPRSPEDLAARGPKRDPSGDPLWAPLLGILQGGFGSCKGSLKGSFP